MELMPLTDGIMLSIALSGKKCIEANRAEAFDTDIFVKLEQNGVVLPDGDIGIDEAEFECPSLKTMSSRF